MALPVWPGWVGAAATVGMLTAVPLAFVQGAFVAFVASTLWVLMASLTMVDYPGPDTQLLEAAEPAPRDGVMPGGVLSWPTGLEIRPFQGQSGG